MISKNQIKHISSLHQKKFRKEEGFFIAEGEKVCQDLIDSNWTVQSLFMTEEFRKEKFSKWTKKIHAETITEKELEKISALTTPQHVLAVAKIPELHLNIDSFKNELSLMLDEIKDPGNLGTIIRIADWFGIKNIVCSVNCADVFNPKTVQATMGSLFRVNVFYESLADVLVKSSRMNIPVFGTLLTGSNIYDSKLSKQGIILIGSESHGISRELIHFITDKLSIPSFSKEQTNKADSLNAAMAAAIVCSEFRRR